MISIHNIHKYMCIYIYIYTYILLLLLLLIIIIIMIFNIIYYIILYYNILYYIILYYNMLVGRLTVSPNPRALSCEPMGIIGRQTPTKSLSMARSRRGSSSSLLIVT